MYTSVGAPCMPFNVDNNHHVAGKDMCVWGFCVRVFEAE